jgi:hypothetical protein
VPNITLDELTAIAGGLKDIDNTADAIRQKAPEAKGLADNLRRTSNRLFDLLQQVRDRHQPSAGEIDSVMTTMFDEIERLTGDDPKRREALEQARAELRARGRRV